MFVAPEYRKIMYASHVLSGDRELAHMESVSSLQERIRLKNCNVRLNNKTNL